MNAHHLLALVVLSAPALARAGSIEGLGFLPGPQASSAATAVSANGSVVVGSSETNDGERAFRWTKLSGMQSLGAPPDNADSSHASAVTPDGAVVVGWSSSGWSISAQRGISEAFRWSDGGGMEGLGDTMHSPDGFTSSEALAVSADGAVVVGFGTAFHDDGQGGQWFGAQAMRWTRATGMHGLGLLPGEQSTAPSVARSVATAVSSDGSVVVGWSTTADGAEAFIWTEADGLRGIGRPDGFFGAFTKAGSVSADGKVIAGIASNGVQSPNWMFRWTEEDGLRTLGGLNPRGSWGDEVVVSADGRVVLSTLAPSIIWDDVQGERFLKSAIESSGLGVEHSGWSLDSAAGLSADGSVLVGGGTSPSHASEAWLVRLSDCGSNPGVPIISGAPDGTLDVGARVTLDGRASRTGLSDPRPVSSYHWSIEFGTGSIVGPNDQADLQVEGGPGGGPVVVRLTVDEGSCASPPIAEVTLRFESGLRTGPNALFLGICGSSNADAAQLHLSANGRVVVFSTPNDSASFDGPFRWTLEDGPASLGRGGFSTRARAISSDGSVIVGEASGLLPEPDAVTPVPYRWSSSGGLVGLGSLPKFAEAIAVSGDGSIVVGNLRVPNDCCRMEPFRWTNETGIQRIELGDLGDGRFFRNVSALSADGKRLFIVLNSPIYPDGGTFRWSAPDGSDGLIDLGRLEGTPAHTRVRAVSPDGAIAVGASSSDGAGDEAFLWTEAQGIQGLGRLPGATRSEATAVSADGNSVFGVSWREGAEPEPFLWRPATGIEPLKDALEREHGLDLAGWNLISVDSISSDDSTLLGTATNPAGELEAWYARLGGCADPPEVARIGGVPNSPPRAGRNIILDGRGSKAGLCGWGSIASYRWEVIEGEATIIGSTDGSSVVIRGEREGSALVRLTVDDGLCDNAGVTTVALAFRPPAPGNWILCDSNGDGFNNISDAVFTLSHLFTGGRASQCPASTDCNLDGRMDLSDAVYDLSFLFTGGPPPAKPYPECASFDGCADACP